MAKNCGSHLSSTTDVVPLVISQSQQHALSSLGCKEFQVGDMVWAKVQPHPWWPAFIYDKNLASPKVRALEEKGHMLVVFFGDDTFSWCHPNKRIHFEPGFLSGMGKLVSTELVKAVDEAFVEVSRRGALGLVSDVNFEPAGVPGFYSVEVAGLPPRRIYSWAQINKARDNFMPAEMLSLLHQLAMFPQREESCDWIGRVSAILYYIRASYSQSDPTYAEAFGVEPVPPEKNDLIVHDLPIRGPTAPPLYVKALYEEPVFIATSGVDSNVTSFSEGSTQDQSLIAANANKKHLLAKVSRAFTSDGTIGKNTIRKRVATEPYEKLYVMFPKKLNSDVAPVAQVKPIIVAQENPSMVALVQANNIATKVATQSSSVDISPKFIELL